MNKYDDALLTIKLVKRDYKNDEFAHYHLNKVVDLLKQAQKQDKLLGLYRKIYHISPMKPLLVETSTDNVHHYECLYCGSTINIGGTIAYNKAFNIYCSKCGQRLDWRG